MKKCPFCAEEIQDDAKKCRHCGEYLDKDNKIKVSKHSDYATVTIISAILPVIGIILGIVYLTKNSKADKKLGEHAIVGSILFSILWFLILLVLGIPNFIVI